MEPVEITAGRLHLRPWGPYDEDALVALMSDPASARWTPAPVPFTAADARERIGTRYPALWESGRGTPLAVLDATSGRVLAWVGLFDLAEGRAEVGWGTLPDARGRGVATAAVAAVCRWGFATLDLEVVEAVVAVGNWASRAVAEKCGFTVDGTRRRAMVQRGRRLDAWTASLLRGEEVTDRRALPGSVTLTDGVVTLRAFRAEDAAEVARACDDPVSAHWLPLPSPYTPEDGRQYVESTCPAGWAEGTEANFAVTDAVTGALLGDCGLKLHQRHLGCGEVGYWTAPWARAGGVASRAAALVASWGLEDLGLHRVELLADPDNVASVHAALRAGFRQEGTARLARPDRHGTPHDMLVLSRVAGDPAG